MVILFLYQSAIELSVLFSVVETNLFSSSFADELNFIKYAPGARFSFSAGYGPVFWFPLSVLDSLVDHETSIAPIRLAFVFLKYFAVIGFFVYLVFIKNSGALLLFYWQLPLLPDYCSLERSFHPNMNSSYGR